MSKSLSLINYEGDCLRAEWLNSEKVNIIDQWNNVVETFDSFDFIDFLSGEKSVIDSRGTQWIFPEHPAEARPTQESIKKFFTTI